MVGCHNQATSQSNQTNLVPTFLPSVASLQMARIIYFHYWVKWWNLGYLKPSIDFFATYLLNIIAMIVVTVKKPKNMDLEKGIIPCVSHRP